MRMRDVIAMHQAAPPPSVSTLIHSMRMRMWEHTYAYEGRHRDAPTRSASFSQYTNTQHAYVYEGHTYAYEGRHRDAPTCSASFSQYTSTYLAVHRYT